MRPRPDERSSILSADRASAIEAPDAAEPLVADAFDYLYLRRHDGEYFDTLGDTSECWPDESPVPNGKMP